MLIPSAPPCAMSVNIKPDKASRDCLTWKKKERNCKKNIFTGMLFVVPNLSYYPCQIVNENQLFLESTMI